MRAERRHNDAVKAERAKAILREHGIDESTPGDPMNVRAKKFATSRWGCSCGMCVNPRRFWRGKNKESLTIRELNALKRINEE